MFAPRPASSTPNSHRLAPLGVEVADTYEQEPHWSELYRLTRSRTSTSIAGST